MVDVPLSKLPAAGSLTGEELGWVAQLSTTVRITGATISALASDNSFNDSGSGFVAAGFAVDDYVHVAGFTGNAANNIVSAKITALTAGKMTIGGTDGDVIVDDAAGETVTIAKWVSVRAPLSSLASGLALISEQTATGTEHAITFSAIPSTYRMLRLEVFGRTDEAAVSSPFTLTCNNDTSAIYDAQRHYGQATTAGVDQFLSSAGWTTTVSLPGTTATASHAGHVVFEFPNYSGTTFYKIMEFKGRQMNSTTTGNAFTMSGGGSYRSTSAISRLDLTIATALKVFVTGSKFRLYGIS